MPRPTRFARLPPGLLLTLAATLFGLARAADSPAPVRVDQRADRIVLTNGLVTAEIAPRTGNLLSFRRGDTELLAEAAYLDWQEGHQRRLSAATHELRGDPAQTDDGRAELAFVQNATGSAPPDAGPALDVALHYVLRPGESGLRMFAVFRHPADYPAAGFGQSRYVLRVRDDLFDIISVDAARTHPLPPADTPVELLGPKESMRFTAGPFAGRITDKYHYFVSSGGHFFHGWMGSESRLGLWLVQGSTEDQNGGPTRQHNTAHWPRMLLKILSCAHYGAPGVSIPAGQSWEKIYGPWLLYANAAPAASTDGAASPPSVLRADAARQAAAERAAFPPAWLRHPAFPAAGERGAVLGRLVVADPQAPGQTATGAWIGLAAPDTAEAPAPDWQRQALGYQPWEQAAADGRFALRGVRPGRYTLHAFVPGVLGEYRRADIEVAAGAELALGDLIWTPVRHGRALWQIGVPDRSAAEFRHGDEPRRWGRWLDYPKDFPADVDFTIGRSDPRTDWNFAQATRPGEDGAGWDGTAWRIRFSVTPEDLAAASGPDAAPDAASGPAVLRLAFAAAHNARLRVSLDGRVLGERGDLGADNALARAGLHGQYSTWDIAFPASLLTPGEHTLTLEQRAGGAPFKNVMYDCLRLELP